MYLLLLTIYPLLVTIIRDFIAPVTVRVGSTLREEEGFVYEAQDLRPHPDFTFESLNFDVGVLILKVSILYGPSVQPIKLVGENQEPRHGEMLETTGWGFTSVSPL